MGDGLLAAFAAAAATRAEACTAALDAASEALGSDRGAGRTAAGEGRKATGLDISLHVGTVQYGNVGTAARLDFTVIGPAVNEASRIEKLCKSLGHNLLVSRPSPRRRRPAVPAWSRSAATAARRARRDGAVRLGADVVKRTSMLRSPEAASRCSSDGPLSATAKKGHSLSAARDRHARWIDRDLSISGRRPPSRRRRTAAATSRRRRAGSG